MPRSKTKDDEAVVVDLSDVESRGGKKGTGGRKRYPEGDYKVKVKSAKWGKSGEKETPRLEVTYVITQGKYKGKDLRDDLYISPKALWRLRQALEALGIEVPSKRVKVTPAKLVGREAAVTLEDEEYDDKIYSKVSDTYTLDDWDESSTDIDDDEDEDEDDEDEDEDDDTDDDDEDEDDEEDDLEDL